MYIVYVRMYVYIVRPRGAAVWHNHDLKSDQLISCMCVYVCVYIVYVFFFRYMTPVTIVI